MMNSLAPLFADVDVVKVIFAILFLIVPAVWGVLSKLSKQQQQQPRPGGGRQPGRPPGGGAQGGKPPGGGARAGGLPAGGARAGRPPGGGLEDEIGEFLRRAAQQRQGQPAPAARPGGRPAGQQVVEAEVVRPTALGDEIKEHVGEYLDAERFQRRASELGEEVAHADDEIQQRLHAKFDHEVSRLAGTPGESSAAPGVVEAEEPEDRIAQLPSTAAAGLAAMLSQPESIRQAIVISEILTRPEQRWT